MPNTNATLNRALANPNDEYFTRIGEIERELLHYRKHFKGKTVYCNCDHWQDSRFMRYFKDNFFKLKLKRLIVTDYVPSDGSLFAEQTAERPAKYVMDDRDMHMITQLEGDGDFRSWECKELLKQADIIVTNPPFSLMREYIAQLIEYNKKFLIIASHNVLHLNSIFPLYHRREIWLGVSRGSMTFDTPEGQKSFGNVGWLTNLKHNYKPLPLQLTKTYSPDRYPKYDNYDAIEVPSIRDIPVDYDGVMGVPFNILPVLNDEQFRLVDKARPWMNGKEMFRRVLIQR